MTDRPSVRARLWRLAWVCATRDLKRGNSYLRMLFVQAARVALLRQANWPKHSFGWWLEAAAKRMNHNVVAAALANKLTRIGACCYLRSRV